MFLLRSGMRLEEYPFVVVKVACHHCPRQGQYRLARLAERHGAKMEMVRLLGLIASDCPARNTRNPGIQFCGAHFPDLKPDGAKGPPKLRVI